MRSLESEGWILKPEIDNKLTHNDLLNTDLYQVGDKIFPKDMNSLTSITGPKILQIKKVKDVSHSKISHDNGSAKSMFRLTLTDGNATVSAMNIQPLKGLSGKTLPGVKLKIRTKCEMLGTFLLLSDRNCEILGGRVEKLVEHIEKNQTISKKAGNVNDGPPKFVPFGSGGGRTPHSSMNKPPLSNDIAKEFSARTDKDNVDILGNRQGKNCTGKDNDDREQRVNNNPGFSRQYDRSKQPSQELQKIDHGRKQQSRDINYRDLRNSDRNDHKNDGNSKRGRGRGTGNLKSNSSHDFPHGDRNDRQSDGYNKRGRGRGRSDFKNDRSSSRGRGNSRAHGLDEDFSNNNRNDRQHDNSRGRDRNDRRHDSRGSNRGGRGSRNKSYHDHSERQQHQPSYFRADGQDKVQHDLDFPSLAAPSSSSSNPHQSSQNLRKTNTQPPRHHEDDGFEPHAHLLYDDNDGPSQTYHDPSFHHYQGYDQYRDNRQAVHMMENMRISDRSGNPGYHRKTQHRYEDQQQQPPKADQNYGQQRDVSRDDYSYREEYPSIGEHDSRRSGSARGGGFRRIGSGHLSGSSGRGNYHRKY